MKNQLLLFILLFGTVQSTAQIIFPESFVVLLDSTKKFKGAFTPELKIRTQKRLLVELSSQTDLVFRIKNNSLLVAQQFELTSFGEERFLESGFLYLKWKAKKEKRWMPEYFSQLQWAAERGLQFKTAIGTNIRHAFFRDKRKGGFAGVGVFYEQEKWNYNGVEDELLPLDQSPIKTNLFRANFYLSYKNWIAPNFFIDISGYYQPRLDNAFQYPRFAASMQFAWQINSNLQLITQYQPIYDFQPIVPINKCFYQFSTTFSLNF